MSDVLGTSAASIEATHANPRIQPRAQWEKIHDPRNPSMAIAADTSERLELFQWLTLKEASGIDRNLATTSKG